MGHQIQSDKITLQERKKLKIVAYFYFMRYLRIHYKQVFNFHLIILMMLLVLYHMHFGFIQYDRYFNQLLYCFNLCIGDGDNFILRCFTLIHRCFIIIFMITSFYLWSFMVRILSTIIFIKVLGLL